MKNAILIFICFISISTFGQNERRAAKVAALYMYNFLTLADVPAWEKAKKTEINALFLCGDKFSKIVEKQWKRNYVGKKVGDWEITSESSSKLSAISSAELVFITNDCELSIASIKKEIGKKPILLIGYCLSFKEPMINFIYQGNKLKFATNESYMSQNGIKIGGVAKTLAVNKISSEKEWESVLDKLEFELENNEGKTMKINSEDLDAILQEYRSKQDELMDIEEDLIFKDISLREKDQEIAIKDSLSYQKELEIKEQEENLKQLNEDIERKREQLGDQANTISQQKLIIFVSIIFLLLFLGAGILIFKSYKDKKKANEKLAEQKRIVDLKNQEIIDSINYAKRIQSAVLPPPKMLEKYLPAHFVLYEPKDIVAGDFYWLESIAPTTGNPLVLFAAADCTGHGVPGAMVSVICNNGLNRSVHEHALSSPGEILDKTREIVIREFEKSEEEVKDGMDIAICSLERNSKPNGAATLKYAGALNPLWIIRKDADEIEEIKANKQPIGKFDELKPYDTHEVTLNKGDSIYIFSDGYADQFGGDKGKKFKPKNLKKRLLEVQDLSLTEQKEALLQTFNDWKGSLEQLDDVCVIGVRV